MDELEGALLDALRPRGLAERARLVIAGGWTPRELCARLPPAVLQSLTPADLPAVAADMRAVDAVGAALRSMLARRLVSRRTRSRGAELRVKGVRLVEVDLYRSA